MKYFKNTYVKNTVQSSIYQIILTTYINLYVHGNLEN